MRLIVYHLRKDSEKSGWKVNGTYKARLPTADPGYEPAPERVLWNMRTISYVIPVENFREQRNI